MGSKINRLMQVWPAGVVGTQRWLHRQGVDARLAGKYVRSGWLTRIGRGAYSRAGSTVDWPGAVHALQQQLHLDVHPGALTAFELRGYAHSLALNGRAVVLFGAIGTRLPAWFRNRRWSQPVSLVTSRLFHRNAEGVSPVTVDAVDVGVAGLERAALEMLYLVPRRQSYEEALAVVTALSALRPQVVRRLLEQCASVKTKRLFMHVAERLRHPWVTELDLARVDFGSGKRTIHPGGRLDTRYHLVVEDPYHA